jgi:formylglycine-generating enzyme required for sulfatase activity
MMGDGRAENGEPVHQVNINYSFYMAKYEVTQAQWLAVMGRNPSYFSECGNNCPVDSIDFSEAQQFINKLNEMNDGFYYRLPTDAEWEYACRAGTTGTYAGDVDAMAWYANNSGMSFLNADQITPNSGDYSQRLSENQNKTHPVGSKLPNSFGLFDMHGNVSEWAQDFYHDTYNGAPTDGSAWLSGGDQSLRVLRGGSWFNNAFNVRSANRIKPHSDRGGKDVGFRVAAVARAQ